MITLVRKAMGWVNGTSGGLQSRALRASAWMSMLLAVRHPVLLFRTFVIAHLLTPRDVGLVAIVLVVRGVTAALGNASFNGALVQGTTITDSRMNTSWCVEVVRGVVTSIGIFALAPLVAGFFDAPEVTGLLRLAALVPLAEGVNNVGLVVFDRDLEYRRKAFYQLSKVVVDAGVSLSLVAIYRSVWGLVIGMAVSSVVASVLSYFVSSYRPRFRFNRTDFRAMAGFSSWVMARSTLRTVSTNLDFILVGRLAGVATLGIYQMAWRISFVVTNAFSNLALNQISFASYARIQEDQQRLRRGFNQTVELALGVALPLVAAIAVSAPMLFPTVLGEVWNGSIIPAQVLAAAAGFRAMRAQATSVMLGMGESGRAFGQDVLALAVLAVGLLIALPERGASGAAVAVLVSAVVVVPPPLRDVKRLLSLTTAQVLQPFLAPVLLVGVVVVAGWGLRLVLPAKGIIPLAGLGLGIVVAYLAAVAGLYLTLGAGPVGVIRRRSTAAS